MLKVQLGEDLAGGVVVRIVCGDAAQESEGSLDLPLLHLHLGVGDRQLALLRRAGELEDRLGHGAACLGRLAQRQEGLRDGDTHGRGWMRACVLRAAC